MEGFLVFLAIIAAVAADFEPGLRVTFGLGLFPSLGNSYFFDIPKTVADAKTAEWKRTSRPAGPFPQLTMYCPADKELCALYDDTKYIAGLQVAISKLEFTENALDWKKRGFTSWNTTVDGQCKVFWTQQQYFVDEEFLSISKEDRLSSRDSTRTLQAGAIWVTGTNKKLEKISTQQEVIASEQVFTEQACIPWMGQHYYYNMTSETECTADQMYPWFLLTSGEDLIGSAFLTFGQLAEAETRNWFERPGVQVVKAIVPNGPDCLYEMAENYGTLTMHIYYTNKPWTIFC